jgi:hypothetical protein
MNELMNEYIIIIIIIIIIILLLLFLFLLNLKILSDFDTTYGNEYTQKNLDPDVWREVSTERGTLFQKKPNEFEKVINYNFFCNYVYLFIFL